MNYHNLQRLDILRLTFTQTGKTSLTVITDSNLLYFGNQIFLQGIM